MALALVGVVLSLNACATGSEKRDVTTVGTPGVVAEAQPAAGPDAALPPGAGNAPQTAPAAPAGGAQAEIVARVNSEPVTREELQRLLADSLAQRELELELGVQDPEAEQLERLALQKLINRRLILQEAARRHLTVTEDELDGAIAGLRRRYQDLDDFGKWMKERGLNDSSLFEAMRAEMLTDRVRMALVEGLLVTEEQVQQFYAAHQGDLRIEEVWLQIIAVKDRAAAEEVQAALQRGEDFGRLAQQRSFGLRATQGGDVGWVDSETLWPPLRDAVRTLKPGEAIGPLQRGEEFLVARLHERRPGRPKTLAEARPEVEAGLLAMKQQELLKAWITEQEKNSKIEVLL